VPLTVLSYGDGAEYWKSLIVERCSNVEVIELAEWRKLPPNLDRVKALIGWRFPNDLLVNLPSIRWIQLISVATHSWVKHPSISSHVVITNTKGIYADSVAEHVLWALLTISRKYHIVLKNQLKHRWRHVSGPGLKGKVLGIFGLGTIGKEVAIRAKAFGMKVIGIVRQVPVTQVPNSVDELYSYKDLTKVSKELDALVLCLPITEETRGLINERVLSGMRTGVFLVDVSRAGIMKDTLVVQALKVGKLAGAALDVFEKEPISRWSRLWSVENLVITPHLAALSIDYRERVGDLICQNVLRFCSQQPLLNVVDREKGY